MAIEPLFRQIVGGGTGGPAGPFRFAEDLRQGGADGEHLLADTGPAGAGVPQRQRDQAAGIGDVIRRIKDVPLAQPFTVLVPAS